MTQNMYVASEASLHFSMFVTQELLEARWSAYQSILPAYIDLLVEFSYSVIVRWFAGSSPI